MTTYAVIGAGGVGGYYGIHLARTGSMVHFLIRAAGAASAVLHLQSADRGWQVRDGEHCHIHRDSSTIPEVDVAIVAVKATANDEVFPRLAGIVRPGGAVLLVQNGIDSEPALAAALPAGSNPLLFVGVGLSQMVGGKKKG